MNWILLISLTTLFFFSSYIKAQQNYSGNSVFSCNETNPSESFLYTCNGRYSSCRGFLIFTARFPYNTIPAIAALTSSDQVEIARLNNVTQFTVFRTDQEVIIPVHCSCSGEYYQSITSYEIPTAHETYYVIANNTYQGLSTCNSLKNANIHSEFDLRPGYKLRVPLRCACPTSEQIATSTEYLVTYSVGVGDTIVALSNRFNVSSTSLTEANSFSDEYSTLHPFTTILIPLPSEPSSSQTIIRVPKMTILPLPPPIARKKRSKHVLSVVAASTSLLILFMIISVIIFLFRKKRMRVPKNRGRNVNISSPKDLIVEIGKLDRALKVFKFAEIKKATGNFRSKNRIKGCVYRGTCGKEVFAVKKINGNACNEVNMLYQINHFNIVKLDGFCENEGDTYLVYEYMKNGSLEGWLRRSKLDGIGWKERIQIALDVANGLLYLHYFTKPGYVHNDIRSSNILLDRNLRAKIANFSHARTENGISLTKRLAPECLEESLISAKVDVFAFGLVLLELITGKYQVFVQDGARKVLSTAIADIMGSRNAEAELSRFVEPPGLSENGGLEYAIQVVKLSLSCLSKDPADRPNMVEVVSLLLKIQYNLQKSAMVRGVMRQSSNHRNEK